MRWVLIAAALCALLVGMVPEALADRSLLPPELDQCPDWCVEYAIPRLPYNTCNDWCCTYYDLDVPLCYRTRYALAHRAECGIGTVFFPSLYNVEVGQ